MRFWGGTQDNGTMRKSVQQQDTWFDVGGGDGGQVLVDPTVDTCALGPSCYVYGTFYSPPASPYRWTDGGELLHELVHPQGARPDRPLGLLRAVRHEPANPNQLFIGTYRLYRTDNARTPAAGDVQWKAISGDLTTGCTGTAPNGARNCTISAIGVGGGQAVYTGSLDGLVYLSTDAQVSDNPTWTRVDKTSCPQRPVSSIAVDRSNYRTAYAGVQRLQRRDAEPARATSSGRSTAAQVADVSGDLPDTPVNSLILDPSYPNTLYAGTDVGAFVTLQRRRDWTALGAGFPLVGDLAARPRPGAPRPRGRHARPRRVHAGRHRHSAPALVLSKVDAGKPVGPSSNVDYTITLKNIGNAAATDVTITDPVPDEHELRLGRQRRDALSDAANVTWSGPDASPAGGSTTVHFTVSIADALKKKVDSIVNDGLKVTAAGGFGTTGSPFVTPIAPPFALALAPAAQRDGGRVGTSVPYTLTIANNGSNADTYALSARAVDDDVLRRDLHDGADDDAVRRVGRLARRLRQGRRSGRRREQRPEHEHRDGDVGRLEHADRDGVDRDDRDRRRRHAARRQRRQRAGRPGELQGRAGRQRRSRT